MRVAGLKGVVGAVTIGGVNGLFYTEVFVCKSNEAAVETTPFCNRGMIAVSCTVAQKLSRGLHTLVERNPLPQSSESQPM